MDHHRLGPCHRPWDNQNCPCMQSDPKFPDCAPGETKHLRGWHSFYDGENLDAELERIEKTGWRKRKLPQPKIQPTSSQ